MVHSVSMLFVGCGSAPDRQIGLSTMGLQWTPQPTTANLAKIILRPASHHRYAGAHNMPLLNQPVQRSAMRPAMLNLQGADGVYIISPNLKEEHASQDHPPAARRQQP